MEFSFIQYSKEMNLPDGVYNARHNKEPAIIRLENGIPVFVSFIGFIKHVDGKDEVRSSSIYHPSGILHSSVELLVPSQKIN